MLAGLRGNRTVRDICREHEIVETLYYLWRDWLLEGGKAGGPPGSRTPTVARPGRHGHPDHGQKTTMVILATVLSSSGGEALPREVC